MKNDNIKYVCNLTLEQQKEVTKELQMALKNVKEKPIKKTSKRSKKN